MMKTKQLFAIVLLMLMAFSTTALQAHSLVSKLPKKGKIVKETFNEKLGYKDLELSNGVHVLLKHTDIEPDEICMSATQRGGSSFYGEKDWANCEMFGSAIRASGLGGLSNSELKKALDGKKIEFWRSLDTYDDYISGSSTNKDLETLFQLIYLNFTDVTKDEESYNEQLNAIESRFKNDDQSPVLYGPIVSGDVFLDSITAILYDHNWRFKEFKLEDMALLNYDRILEIAKERTANAAGYNFVFVGSFNEAKIRPLIERYIASLPANKGVKSNWVNVTTRPQKETVCHFTQKMETPQTSINIRWINTKIPYSIENGIKARFLSDILKLRIYRELIPEGVWTTHPVGGNEQHYTEGDHTFTEIHSFVDVKPEYADEVIQILKKEMLRACGHIDEAYIEEFKQEALESIKNRKENNYSWLSMIHESAEGADVDPNSNNEQFIKSLTPETISAFARELLATGHMLEIVMSPE